MKVTDEDRQELGKLLTQKRELENQLNKVNNKITDLTLKLIGRPFTQKTPDIPESTFSNLNYEKKTSDRMGAFEVAEKEKNGPQKFAEALDILKQNNAEIDNRFHPEGYIFAYWEFRGRIYRAKLKQ
jgi:hypothetical protein